MVNLGGFFWTTLNPPFEVLDFQLITTRKQAVFGPAKHLVRISKSRPKWASCGVFDSRFCVSCAVHETSNLSTRSTPQEATGRRQYTRNSKGGSYGVLENTELRRRKEPAGDV
ncbi:MAG: LOW QUALITY PROTEIN: hypothetical protein BJ554DRAFT_8405 [Olpidium bornovanus]|uniref:Uncharacterized protein n=1 Tax=Olpidium bornovanus TaxID=278681 RepID=A0A8H7ZUN8_9FUNG|nr:MAG: LOW QUALITY PROTEIN: hypothetical protein BJ554DRAFT_8405 [Olpidium bornovanus]